MIDDKFCIVWSYKNMIISISVKSQFSDRYKCKSGSKKNFQITKECKQTFIPWKIYFYSLVPLLENPSFQRWNRKGYIHIVEFVKCFITIRRKYGEKKIIKNPFSYMLGTNFYSFRLMRVIWNWAELLIIHSVAVCIIFNNRQSKNFSLSV